MNLPGYRWLARWVFGFALISAAAFPARAVGQPDTPFIPVDKVQIPGVVRELALRLADADRLAAKQRWQDAADAYLTLIREHGDELVPIAPASEPLFSSQRFMQMRLLAHQRVVRSPPPLWAAYRKRMDSISQKWLDEAQDNRDAALLRRVVDEAFVSTGAATALDMLGDLAFERGDFAEARHWWSLLARPIASRADADLFYPDTRADVAARVRAKHIMTLLFQERADDVPTEIAAYRQAHGSASGLLAGRNGGYASTLEGLARQHTGLLPAAEQDWPTFGGDSSRNRMLPNALSPGLWVDGPTWRVRLETGDKVSDSEAIKAVKPKAAGPGLPFHPIVYGGVVYASDARFIRGFDLKTGKLVHQFDLLAGRKIAGADELRFPSPSVPDLHYTLTAAEGFLCARLGSAWIGPLRLNEKRQCQSWLVCLKLPDKAGAAPTVCWIDTASEKPGELAALEGAPLIHRSCVYVASSRLKGNRLATAVSCFDARSGGLRWEQDVCEAPEFPDDALPRRRHHLLTLSGPNVVYCSHAGAIVALDAFSGNRVWAVRYASRGLKQSRPELAPPVAADHRILVAPADTQQIFCLHAATGGCVWERQGIDVMHLLGVSSKHVLLASTQGLRALRVDAGEDDGGWQQPRGGSITSHGRGLLADGWIFWPTQDAKLPWRAVNSHDGNLVRNLAGYDPALFRFLVTGNAIVGRGCLVIATSEELVGFVPASPPIGPPRT